VARFRADLSIVAVGWLFVCLFVCLLLGVLERSNGGHGKDGARRRRLFVVSASEGNLIFGGFKDGSYSGIVQGEYFLLIDRISDISDQTRQNGQNNNIVGPFSPLLTKLTTCIEAAVGKESEE
jgi:hypothetical protein